MELTIKYTELIMAAIIIVQIIMLITISLNLKNSKNALQKIITPPKNKQTNKTTLREVSIRSKTPIRNSPNQTEKENEPIQGRNKTLRQRDDLGNV